MLMEKNFDQESNTWIVSLSGDIDLYNAPELKEELTGLAGANICLDCQELKYIDSTGLGVLVSILKKCQKEDHTVCIRGLKPHIYRIFQLTNLHTIFKIEVPET